jgi:hypothetical protein
MLSRSYSARAAGSGDEACINARVSALDEAVVGRPFFYLEVKKSHGATRFFCFSSLSTDTATTIARISAEFWLHF